MELPFWLASSLVARNMVDVQLPKHYRERFRGRLRVDPIVVNLREKTPYYYEFGMKVANLFKDETIIPELRHAMTLRYRTILDRSLNSRNEDTKKFTEKLTNSEQFLFKAGTFVH